MATSRIDQTALPILSEAISLRAEAYRRWRRAAEAEPKGSLRSLYEALAAFECDRYEELLRRFLLAEERPTGSTLELPAGAAAGAPLRLAAVAAAEERRAWAERLRGAGSESPERGILAALVEEAQRALDLTGVPAVASE